jgi:AraC family transcriptional regulator
MSVVAETIWYIEAHLTGNLSVESIADGLGISRFHATRAFALTTGMSISEYARARRLSLSARALASGANDIRSIALEAGYGSHEAFTRAFRQHFGKTPEQVRAEGSIETLNLMEAMRMNPQTDKTLAAPRIVERDAILLFGIGRVYGGNSGESMAGIPAQWERFQPHLRHTEHRVGSSSYGACTNTDDKGCMLYVTAVEVSEFPSEPADFTRLRIPPQTYAVFEHTGHVTGVRASWSYIWEQGLREAGKQAADGACFELYGENFDGQSGNGGFELWVPIRS